MTPRFEAFLVRLYVDPETRQRFLADPAGEAARAELTERERRALLRVDPDELALAAASFERKRRERAGQARPRPSWALYTAWLARLGSSIRLRRRIVQGVKRHP